MSSTLDVAVLGPSRVEIYLSATDSPHQSHLRSEEPLSCAQRVGSCCTLVLQTCFCACLRGGCDLRTAREVWQGRRVVQYTITQQPSPLGSEISDPSSINSATFSPEGVVVYSPPDIVKHTNSGIKGQVHIHEHTQRFFEASPPDGKLLDLGCGTGKETVEAARRVKEVYGIDCQDLMILNAKELARTSEVNARVTFIKANLTNLPFAPNHFDRILSRLVTSNLREDVFKIHFDVISCLLKPKGECLVIYPNDLHVVFTGCVEGMTLDERGSVISKLKEALDTFNENGPLTMETDIEKCQAFLREKRWKNIFSATFFILDGKLTLLEEENRDKITLFQPVLRLLPDHVVVPNYYCTQQACMDALPDNLTVSGYLTPKFNSSDDREMFNQQNDTFKVGEAYERHSPFAILFLRKTTNWSVSI